MTRPRRNLLCGLTLAAALAGPGAWAAATPRAALQVCADPANLPFSNRAGEGFENRIAAILADALDDDLTFVWQAQRRGFLRRGLQAGLCDAVMGVPPGLPNVATTRPLYRSTYVFVTRRAVHAAPLSFDDPALPGLRIGLQMVGAEGASTPPAQALAVRKLVDHIRGFPMWGDDEAGPGPVTGRIVQAVLSGTIDTAIVWGPFGGYFARDHADQLVLTPILHDPRLPQYAFAFDIAVGVRVGDTELRDRLQQAIDRRRSDIDAVLHAYGVPLLPPADAP